MLEVKIEYGNYENGRYKWSLVIVSAYAAIDTESFIKEMKIVVFPRVDVLEENLSD